MYQSNATQRGCGILPKRFVNFRECEVMRFYKLHAKGMVEPVSMTVPRKVCTVHAQFDTCTSCTY